MRTFYLANMDAFSVESVQILRETPFGIMPQARMRFIIPEGTFDQIDSGGTVYLDVDTGEIVEFSNEVNTPP